MLEHLARHQLEDDRGVYLGWIITLPIAGLIAGCLMGIIINAPRWNLPVLV